jgi:hypothetical protein
MPFKTYLTSDIRRAGERDIAVWNADPYTIAFGAHPDFVLLSSHSLKSKQAHREEMAFRLRRKGG